MKLLKNIFSIKNKGIYKIVTVLGFKIKIKSQKLVIQQLKKEILNFEDIIAVEDNYKKVLKKLRLKIKNEKLNVVFLTNEPQKWTYDSLYKEFKNSPYFNPVVVVVPRYKVHLGKDETRMSLKEQFDFYKERNYDVEYGYKDGKYIDLKTFNPDIIFYLQINEVKNYDEPVKLSEYALTSYVTYSSQITDFYKHYNQKFHKQLFIYFSEDDSIIDLYEKYKKHNSSNCVSVGYPKLDVYLNNDSDINKSRFWKNPEKYKIIYAPHHTFTENSQFNFSTFPQNYKLILDLAKKYSDTTTWIFKPHPILKYKLLKEHFMSKEQVEDYYNEWAKIGLVYDNGDYFDIFKSSDLMITDCASFLTEYLPSGKPLIRMVNNKAVSLNSYGTKVISQYYQTHNNNELQNTFEDLVIRKNDYKKGAREKLISEVFDTNESSAKKIINYLLSVLN